MNLAQIINTLQCNSQQQPQPIPSIQSIQPPKFIQNIQSIQSIQPFQSLASHSQIPIQQSAIFNGNIQNIQSQMAATPQLQMRPTQVHLQSSNNNNNNSVIALIPINEMNQINQSNPINPFALPQTPPRSRGILSSVNTLINPTHMTPTNLFPQLQTQSPFINFSPQRITNTNMKSYADIVNLLRNNNSQNPFVTYQSIRSQNEPITIPTISPPSPNASNVSNTLPTEKETNLDKPLHYKCNVCFAPFSNKHSMTVHKRIHLGERPFVCTICNSSYKTQNVQHKHMKSAHPMVWETIKHRYKAKK